MLCILIVVSSQPPPPSGRPHPPAAPTHRPPLNFILKSYACNFPVWGLTRFCSFHVFHVFFVIHKIVHAPLPTTTTKKKKREQNEHVCVCWNQHMLLILNPFFECEMSSSPVSYLFSFYISFLSPRG